MATFGKGGAGVFVVNLDSTRSGSLEGLGYVELRAGDAGLDEDNALLYALGEGTVSEESLLRLFGGGGVRPAGLEEPPAVPWVARSTIEPFVEPCEKYGPQNRSRVEPLAVSTEPTWSEWWSPVSPYLARLWAATFEQSFVEHAGSERSPPWFPLPGRGSIEITGTRVLQAVRLTTGAGQPSVGAVAGRFDTVFQWLPDEPSGAVEISWAAVLTVTELGEPQAILWSAFGSLTDGETRGVYDLERVTNLDDDLEYELVIGTDKYAGTSQLVFDISDPAAPKIQDLPGHGCD
jgi:hypothetical protein